MKVSEIIDAKMDAEKTYMSKRRTAWQSTLDIELRNWLQTRKHDLTFTICDVEDVEEHAQLKIWLGMCLMGMRDAKGQVYISNFQPYSMTSIGIVKITITLAMY